MNITRVLVILLVIYALNDEADSQTWDKEKPKGLSPRDIYGFITELIEAVNVLLDLKQVGH